MLSIRQQRSAGCTASHVNYLYSCMRSQDDAFSFDSFHFSTFSEMEPAEMPTSQVWTLHQQQQVLVAYITFCHGDTRMLCKANIGMSLRRIIEKLQMQHLSARGLEYISHTPVEATTFSTPGMVVHLVLRRLEDEEPALPAPRPRAGAAQDVPPCRVAKT